MNFNKTKCVENRWGEASENLKLIATVSCKGVKKKSDPLVVKKEKQVVIFFIGGAADKNKYFGNGPTNIIRVQVDEVFQKLIDKNNITKEYKSIHIGFDDVRGDEDIEKNVISQLSDDKEIGLYIVGHSLGGWNGAHLSRILSDKGYTIQMLITLDPVGKGTNTQIISDVYWTTPKPIAKYWINVSTYPESYQSDDFIADLGGQWNPGTLPQINEICECHHRSAGIMFKKHLKSTNISTLDMLLQNIKLFLEK